MVLRILVLRSCVCLSVHRGRRFHVTTTHDALNLNVQGPPDKFKLVQLEPQCTGSPRQVQTCATWTSLDRNSLLVTSGGQDWRPVQTCSLEVLPSGADIWWLLKHVPSAHIPLQCFFTLMFFTNSTQYKNAILPTLF